MLCPVPTRPRPRASRPPYRGFGPGLGGLALLGTLQVARLAVAAPTEPAEPVTPDEPVEIAAEPVTPPPGAAADPYAPGPDGTYSAFPPIHDPPVVLDAAAEAKYPKHGLVTGQAVLVRERTEKDGRILGILRAGARVRADAALSFGGGMLIAPSSGGASPISRPALRQIHPAG